MDALTAVQSSRSPFGDGSPKMGLAPSGELVLSLYADSADVPRMAAVTPYVRVVSNSITSEWLQKGVYYVDTREQDHNGVLTLRCYDALLLAERAQPWSALSWPALDIDVINEIAGILGVQVDSRTTALMTAGYRIPMPAQYTMRETLQYIAALYGGSFIMSDLGKLRLLPLALSGTAAELSHIGTADCGPAFAACSGIRFLVDREPELFAGNETGYVYEIECPWATQAAANALLNQMSGYVYRPYEAQGAMLDPAMEPGDWIANSNNAFAIDPMAGRQLHKILTTFDSLCASTVGAPGEKAIDHEMPYETAQERKYSRRMDSIESELSIQASEIAAKVERSGGDASSFAWVLNADKFQLISDGSTVLLCDDEGIRVVGNGEFTGKITATSGVIGGCSITDGSLVIQNANIENINASKITAGTLSVARLGSKSITGAKLQDYTLSSTKLSDGSAVNRVIGPQAVSYDKESAAVQAYLDQVPVNAANIDTIAGYFVGSANFNALLAVSIALNGHQLSLETIPIGGVDRKVVCWV